MKKYKGHIVWALVTLVALGGGFFWGQASAGSARGGFSGAAGAYGSSTRRFAGSSSGGSMVTGQITGMDSSSLTLQLPSGSSQVIFYSSSTQVSEPTIVPVSKLAVGANILVGGTSNTDGSMTAESIQVRSAGGNAAAGMGQ